MLGQAKTSLRIEVLTVIIAPMAAVCTNESSFSCHCTVECRCSGWTKLAYEASKLYPLQQFDEYGDGRLSTFRT